MDNDLDGEEWMHGDIEIENLMIPVNRAIFRHFELGSAAAVEIHNRAYEAIVEATRKQRDDLPELPGTCHWVEDCDGTWQYNCGKGHGAWVFTYSGSTPRENGMHYCPGCGARLIEHPYTEESDDEEAP